MNKSNARGNGRIRMIVGDVLGALALVALSAMPLFASPLDQDAPGVSLENHPIGDEFISCADDEQPDCEILSDKDAQLQRDVMRALFEAICGEEDCA